MFSPTSESKEVNWKCEAYELHKKEDSGRTRCKLENNTKLDEPEEDPRQLFK